LLAERSNVKIFVWNLGILEFLFLGLVGHLVANCFMSTIANYYKERYLMSGKLGAISNEW
jgi:hypothetical protein